MARKDASSYLLSDDENEAVVRILRTGRRVDVLAMTVARLMMALPDPSEWCRYYCGVVCLVKDYSARSFYIEMVDISKFEAVYTQEIYLEMTYSLTSGDFHQFPGDFCTVGLHFTDETEAAQFGQTVRSKCKVYRSQSATQQQCTKPTTETSSAVSTFVATPDGNESALSPQPNPDQAQAVGAGAAAEARAIVPERTVSLPTGPSLGAMAGTPSGSTGSDDKPLGQSVSRPYNKPVVAPGPSSGQTFFQSTSPKRFLPKAKTPKKLKGKRSWLFGRKLKPKDKKMMITGPTNFRHLSHFGRDEVSGE